ncbi:MAG TPA: hypothetical protein VHT30_08660 [Acidimicrobiales bacterium]|nr:hypothetical protein [Acidimicrobiales bacterium]
MVIGILFAAIVIVGAVQNADKNPADDIPSPGFLGSTPPVFIKYTVTGPDTALVTYTGASGIDQNSDAVVSGAGWTDYETLPELSIADISAQNSTDGAITCAISVGGTVVATNTAYGPFAIAQCQVPDAP